MITPLLHSSRTHLLVDADGAQPLCVQPGGEIFEHDGLVQEDALVEGRGGGGMGGGSGRDRLGDLLEEGDGRGGGGIWREGEGGGRV